MELYQAEWCPHSHRVRQRLTELGLDFTALQVPPEPEDREDMREAVDEDSIPVLVDGEEVLSGDDDILAYLDRRYAEPPGHGEASRLGARGGAGVPGGRSRLEGDRDRLKPVPRVRIRVGRILSRKRCPA